jgi:anaerobic magnesium-protoporphyrin IX monomethyl ester cyclase
MRIQLILAPPIAKHKEGELNERIAPPLGILYIASYLRANMKNIELSVFDGQIEGFDETISKIKKFCPDILGISAHTLIANGAYEVAKRIKKEHPQTLVIMGGCHCTGFPEDVIKKSGADLVCVGEGELTMLEVSQAFSSKKKVISSTDFGQIDGLAYADGERIVYTKARQFIEDLDTIPLPARDLINFKDYSGWYITKRLPETRIISSRGCPFHCTFCSCAVWKTSKPIMRTRSAKNIVDEIEQLMKDYGIREFGDDCDEFNCNIKVATEICREIIKRKLDIPWRSQVRAYPLPDDLVRLMSESGCWQVHMGIESGNERTLKGIGKNITLKQVEDGCRVLRKYNIEVVGMFMLYNVWEEDGKLCFENTNETKQTMDYALKLYKKGLINQFMWGPTNPYPGSKLFEIARRHNLIKKSLLDDWEAWRRDELYAMKLPGVDIVEQTRLRTKGQFLKLKHLLFSKGKINLKDWKYFLQKGLRIIKDESHAKREKRKEHAGL